MKGKAVVLAIVVLIALLVVTPSVAAGSHNGQGLRHGAITMRGGGGGGGGGHADGSFTLRGQILGLDYDARTIEVEVWSPASLTKLNPLTVQTTDTTHFKQCDDGVSEGIKFQELVEGWEVKIAGTVDGDGNFIAERVIQYVP